MTPFYGDDLLNNAEACVYLNMKPATLRKYIRGEKDFPRLPYTRIGTTRYFSKFQIAEWMLRIQKEVVDSAMVDVRRAHREQGITP